MPYLDNTIGAYSFVDMRGSIFYSQEEVEVIHRAGVDGSGLRRLGERGRPFTLTTRQFHADFEAARDALETYRGLVGFSAAVNLVRNGVDHGDYFVLRVEEVETVAVLNPTGNASTTDTALQTCSWQLLAET